MRGRASGGQASEASPPAFPDTLPGPIPPWDPSRTWDGDRFVDKRPLDPAAGALLDAERRYLDRRRAAQLGPGSEDLPLHGIALSGGGIRSATFSLGVLQALAAHDLLKRFDYLSTVSGGGYIGASLTWLTSKTARDGAKKVPRDFGVGPSRGDRPPFPYGTEDPRALPPTREPPREAAMLRYLRQHGNYLIPGAGITLTSGIVVVLRGILLNLLVWIPLAAAVMYLMIAISRPSGPQLAAGAAPAAFAWLLGAAAGLLLLCLTAFAAYSLVTYRARSENIGRRYGWRRRFEAVLRFPFWLAGVLIVVGSVPYLVTGVTGWFHGSVAATGLVSTVAGLISGLVGFVRSARPEAVPSGEGPSRGSSMGLIAPVGAALLLYGILLLGYASAYGAYAAPDAAGRVILAAVVAVAVLTGWFVNLNYITIHRFYRDRLLETFLPDIDAALENVTGPAIQADPARLSEMCAPDHPLGPYHIINANLVLTQSDNRTLRLRGGDNFILSPLYCGSNATGWRATRDYAGDEITLGSAMAISGAAANPWAGSAGTGVTRNPLVSTLMSLMNLRLGYWLPNPRHGNEAGERFRANHFNPGLAEVIGRNLTETSRTCLLSDGGHFENLGLYELVRRRVRLIVLCDGTADPDYQFSDLQSAMARIEADFGAHLQFEDDALSRFMPIEEAGYPRKALFSKSAYVIADIIYADGSKGVLAYLNTALVKGLRLQLLGYKGANWDFPDQSTGDQFFDEAQFEAYRELGYVIADRLIREEGARLGLTTAPPRRTVPSDVAAE